MQPTSNPVTGYPGSMRMNSAHKDPVLVVAAGLAAWLALTPLALAQTKSSAYSPRLAIQEIAPSTVEVVGNDLRLLGTASSPAGLTGDQMNASLASSGANGFLVWQDNFLDGQGLGIGGRFINLQTGVASPQIVRVNQDPLLDQENPKVAALNGGGAVVVWQSGKSGRQSIKARLLDRSGNPAGSEITIASATASSATANPIVVSSGGGFAVAWEASEADGVGRKVHFQRFNSTGGTTGPIRILGTSARVDRAPALAAHADGRIVVAWVAEMASTDVLNLGGANTRLEVNSDIFTQTVASDGSIGSPVWVNGGSAPCDAPAAAALPGGSTLIGWSEFSLDATSNWDIKSTVVSASGSISSSAILLNTYRPFGQVGLRFAVNGSDILAVWSSRGSDGSGLGAAARALDQTGTPQGDEFVVNSVRMSDQMTPTVAATPQGFRAVWSSLAGIATGVDLKARDIRKTTGQGRRSIKLTWNSIPGSKYTLESSSDLSQWGTYLVIPSAASNQQSLTLDPGAVPNTYFRVKLDR